MSAVSPEETTNTPEPGTGWHGQTFLVGETVYLRIVEPEDSEYAMSLRSSIYPWGPERAKKWIEEDLKSGDLAVFVVRRKVDDAIVGSVTARHSNAMWGFDPHAPATYGERGEQWLAEALTLLVPYFVHEQHVMMATFWLRADRTTIIHALEELGARQVVRFRETYRVNGGYVDQVVYEYLNPKVVARLGDPLNDELPRTGSGEPRPVIAPVEVEGEPPKNAILIGPRVYLRPFRKGDGEIFARHSRAETEPVWSNGRVLFSTVGTDRWFSEVQEKEPPYGARFAICLRETDELIGGVGVDALNLINGTAETDSHILSAENRAKGYGSEAKNLAIHYAFNVLGLHSLQSYVIFPNTRSAAALRKQGYRETGRLHWWFPYEGSHTHFVTFELLADEWRALPRAPLDEGSPG